MWNILKKEMQNGHRFLDRKERKVLAFSLNPLFYTVRYNPCSRLTEELLFSVFRNEAIATLLLGPAW